MNAFAAMHTMSHDISKQYQADKHVRCFSASASRLLHNTSLSLSEPATALLFPPIDNMDIDEC